VFRTRVRSGLLAIRDEFRTEAIDIYRALGGRDMLRSSKNLWWAFGLLHAIFFLALLPTITAGHVLGDLPLYRRWAIDGLALHSWIGIHAAWVYPIGALAPITFAALAGPAAYQLLWFLLTAALNALAVVVLTRRGRDQRGITAAWVWLLFCLLLSPVGLLRLEGITAPLVVMALAIVARRPFVAGVLLAVATWIKVWPAAVILAVVITARRRVSVMLAAVVVTFGVVAFTVLAGGMQHLTGFITAQSDRALQLEAPVTTPWVWLAALHRFDTVIYQNTVIDTREVSGPGAGLIASLMTPLMFAAIAAICVLMCIALARKADPSEIFLTGALALVGAFIVFNKVGSPQYILWLVPVVTAGVAHNPARWRTPAILLAIIATLTTLIFPVFYMQLVKGNLMAVSLLSARNLLLGVLLIWAVRAVLRVGRMSESLDRGTGIRQPLVGSFQRT